MGVGRGERKMEGGREKQRERKRVLEINRGEGEMLEKEGKILK